MRPALSSAAHQQRRGGLVERVPFDVPGHVGEDLVVVALHHPRLEEQTLGTVVEEAEPTGLLLDRSALRDVGEGTASPHCQRVLGEELRLDRIVDDRPAGVVDHRCDVVHVDLTGIDVEHVATGCRADERTLAVAVGLQDVTQLGDLERDRLGGTRRQSVTPDLVEEPVGRERHAGFERQLGQHCPLLRSTDVAGFAADRHGHRPEHADPVHDGCPPV